MVYFDSDTTNIFSEEIIIDDSLTGKTSLLSYYSRKLSFPYITVDNWDAFRDVMTSELEWLDSPIIDIRHTTFPCLTPHDLSTYISIIVEAAMRQDAPLINVHFPTFYSSRVLRMINLDIFSNGGVWNSIRSNKYSISIWEMESENNNVYLSIEFRDEKTCTFVPSSIFLLFLPISEGILATSAYLSSNNKAKKRLIESFTSISSTLETQIQWGPKYESFVLTVFQTVPHRMNIRRIELKNGRLVYSFQNRS